MASPWYSEGVKVNPAGDAELAKTGQMPASGQREFSIIVSSSVACAMAIEHRNAANDATVRTQFICVAAFETLQFELFEEMDVDEILRVVSFGAITGTLQASIFVRGI